MNKYFLFICFILLCSLSNAQTSEGRFLIGTSINYTNQINDNYDAQGNLNGLQLTNNNLSIYLQAGYMATDFLAIGLSANYVDNKVVNQNLPATQFTSISKTWYYGIFGRTYTRITEKLYFNNSLSISIQSGTNNAVTDSIKAGSQTPTSLKVSGYIINYAPGLSYFLNDWFSINASIGVASYDHLTTTITSGSFTGTSTSNGQFNLSVPLANFNFGIDFYFGKASNAVVTQSR